MIRDTGAQLAKIEIGGETVAFEVRFQFLKSAPSLGTLTLGTQP